VEQHRTQIVIHALLKCQQENLYHEQNRSEERRVGKECKSGWTTDHDNNKTETGKEQAEEGSVNVLHGRLSSDQEKRAARRDHSNWDWQTMDTEGQPTTGHVLAFG